MLSAAGADHKLKYWSHSNIDLMMEVTAKDYPCQRINKDVTIHPEGNMNVCTMAIHPKVVETFQTGL